MDEEQKDNENEQNQALTVSNPFTKFAGDFKKKIEELINKFKNHQEALPPGKTPTTRPIKVVQSQQDVFSMMSGNPLKKLVDRITSARMSKAASKNEVENEAILAENRDYRVNKDDLASIKDSDKIIPPINPIIATPETLTDEYKNGIKIVEIGEDAFKPKKQEPKKEQKEVHIEAGTIGEESREEVEEVTRDNE